MGSALAQTAQTPPTATQKPADTAKPAPPDAKQPTPPKVVVPDHPSGVRILNDQNITLSSGDVIQIQVENHPTLDGAYAIPGVGKLLLPEAGEIKVAGITVTQFRDNLQAQLEKTLNNVFVRVLLREVHSRHVAITGTVLHQGDFDMGTKEYKFLDLIDLAGGLLPPSTRTDAKVSEFKGTLYRGKTSLPVDIDGAYRQPDGSANFVIQPDDRLQIELKPFVTHEIHILGQIPKQGTYPLDNNTTVLGLFGLAGFPSTSASLSTAYVIRGDRKIPLDLRPVLTGNVDLAVNKFKFEDDDTLFIPTVLQKFMVWGQVGRQGNYPYPEATQIHLLDAITGAGEAANGEYRKVQLIRNEGGKQTVKTINVDRMIRKGLMSDNELIKPDDIVFVPPRNNPLTLGSANGAIGEILNPLIMLSYFGIHPY